MKKRKVALLTAIGLGIAMLAGCGSDYGGGNYLKESAAAGAYEDAGYYDDYDYAAPEEAAESYDEGSVGSQDVGEIPDTSGRKLIKTVSITAETEDFDNLTKSIVNDTNALGGYVESSSISGNSYGDEYGGDRTADYTLRIPAKNLEQFLEKVDRNTNVTYRTENVEDITLSYVDMQSHKKALEEEQDRLYEMMEKANDLDELIVLENRLTEVRYQLESMESQLRTYDNLVDYSTVNLTVNEVKKYSPPVEMTTWEKISRGFSERAEAIGEGFKNFGIWFVVHILDILLTLFFIFVIVLVIVLIVKACLKAEKKAVEKARQKAEAEGRPYPAPAAAPKKEKPVKVKPQKAPKGGKKAPGQPMPMQPGQNAPGQPMPMQPGQNAPGQPMPPQPGQNAPGQPMPMQPGQNAPGQPMPMQPGQNAPGQPMPMQLQEPVTGQPMPMQPEENQTKETEEQPK